MMHNVTTSSLIWKNYTTHSVRFQKKKSLDPLIISQYCYYYYFYFCSKKKKGGKCTHTKILFPQIFLHGNDLQFSYEQSDDTNQF